MSSVFLQHPIKINDDKPYDPYCITEVFTWGGPPPTDGPWLSKNPTIPVAQTRAMSPEESVSQDLVVQMAEEIDASLVSWDSHGLPQNLTIAKEIAPNFQFHVGGTQMITIKPNGNVDIPADVILSDAAKTFWHAVGYHAPENTDTVSKLKEAILELKAEIAELTKDKAINNPSKTSLSRVGEKPLMLHIKNNLKRITNEYLLEPNNSATRVQVKYNVDNFLHSVLNRDGIFDYATICDSTNNTPSMIDRNDLRIDVHVKFNKTSEFINMPITIKQTVIEDEEQSVNNLVVADRSELLKSVLGGKKEETTINVLPGGESLGQAQMQDLKYFHQNLARGLRLPSSYFNKQQEDEPTKVKLISTPTGTVGAFLELYDKGIANAAFDDAMELVK